MNKITVLIIFFISFFQLNAQDDTREHEYLPMAIEGAHWMQSLALWDDPNFMDFYDYDYKIEGDTIISGTQYKKVFYRFFRYQAYDDQTTSFSVGEDQLFGAIRDEIENKKVYGIVFSDDEGDYPTVNPYTNFYCPLNEELLLYDFSMSVDEVIDTDCLELGSVISINEQFLFEQDRIVQSFDMDQHTEGIGSMYGLFENYYGIVSGAESSLGNYCVGTDDECYGDMPGYTNEVNEYEYKINISPNPAKNFITIEVPLENTIRLVSIFNSLGELVQKETNDFSQIDISSIPSNTLFVHIELDNTILVRKIVKE